MKNVFITCLLALPLLLVSAAPLDVPQLDRRSGVRVVARPAPPPTDSCTCHGRVHRDVFNNAYDSAPFFNLEGLPLPNCPNPMKRWKLNDLDRAVYSGNHFCGCITHQGAATRTGFIRC